MLRLVLPASSLLLLVALLQHAVSTTAEDVGHVRPAYIGPHDRFWRFHNEEETLVVDGVDHYHNIKQCVDAGLTDDDRQLLEVVPTNRTLGKRIADDPRLAQQRFGKVILVEVKNAITPVMVKAVRVLSKCIEIHTPKFHEVRPMYQEYNLPNDDDNLGGNTPTHLLPFLGVFLPMVVKDLFRSVRFAYDAAGWKALSVRDEILGQFTDHRSQSFPEPEQLGFRASEHLSYADFPLLEAHHDGMDTAYTINFAFSGPDEYQGGYFYIIDDAGQKTFLKPDKYSCMVLLGGTYLHGVTQITGGHREMFSSEMWYNPDLPLGTTLWTSNGANMEEYISQCNAEEDQLAAKEGRPPEYGAHKCTVSFSQFTSHGVNMNQVRNKYTDGEDYEGDGPDATTDYDSDDDDEDWSDTFDEEEDERRYRRQMPTIKKKGTPEIEDFEEDDRYYGTPKPQLQQRARQQLQVDGGKDDNSQYWSTHEERYLNATEEPNFIVPRQLQPGQMAPLYFRDTKKRLQDDESFAIGLPPELLEEFTKYMDANGMLKTAKKIAYEMERSEEEHTLLTLDDGRKWGVMHPRWGGNDMVWIDPGDEECFESMIDVLRRGNFDIVLDAIGEYFELDGLMIQGIGPIFISHFDHDPEFNQIHHDLIEAKGSFFNVVVPLYIPEKGAPLYVGDQDRSETIQMRYNVGTLLGAGSLHGTGECDYREEKDVRLSVAIYVADVNDDNVDIVASDSTSLWPTQGDVHWFKAQEGRLWRADDPTRSLKQDQGRHPISVQDPDPEYCQSKSKELCESDPAGYRLECPKTCRVYLDDDEYYAQLKAMVNDSNSGGSKTTSQPATQGGQAGEPTCGSNEPSCIETSATAEK